MSEKPKRKNDEPIPCRYWWIFSILALVLLIGLRFPIRVLSYWWLNPLLYMSMTLILLLAVVFFMKTYKSQHWIVVLMLLTVILAGVNFSRTLIDGGMVTGDSECQIENRQFYRTYHCMTHFYNNKYVANFEDYLALPILPVGIQTRFMLDHDFYD